MIMEHKHCEKCDERDARRDDKIMGQISLGIVASVLTVIGVTLILAFT